MSNENEKLNFKVNSNNSFIAIIAAWLIMNIGFAIITAIQYGKANDSGVILFWSGIYIVLSWVLFLWLPTVIFKRIKFGKLIYYAAPIMAIYAGIVYTLLLGKTFQFSETYRLFLPYSILTGFVYGILVTILNRKKEVKKMLWISVPVISIIFYFIFPQLFPKQALRFMPDEIQDKIVSRIVPKLKVGDEYSLNLSRSPSLNSYKKSKSGIWAINQQKTGKDHNSSLSASNKYISYELEVRNGIITKLNYELKK
jgi:hypothetical protein